ncbi:hypothetical protein [Catenuloplanes indicus]|uniref:hypothetical protein n=1 Tax=Catenuloplanes indicus TaxID=137267 RepID=UPI0027D90789|nr:hypothetical protein [Catenuloplanes indicus]
MRRRRFDPQTAAASVEALAAVTDEQLAAAVCDALRALAALHATGTWPASDFDTRAVEAFNCAQRFRALRAAAVPELEASVEVAGPMLGVWWPDGSVEANAVRDAVEQVRYASMVLPGLAVASRGFTLPRKHSAAASMIRAEGAMRGPSIAPAGRGQPGHRDRGVAASAFGVGLRPHLIWACWGATSFVVRVWVMWRSTVRMRCGVWSRRCCRCIR